MKRTIQIQVDDSLIDELKNFTDEKTASKAFIVCAESYLAYLEAGDSKNRHIERLKEELTDLKSYNLQLLDTLNSIESTYRQLQEVIGQGSLSL